MNKLRIVLILIITSCFLNSFSQKTTPVQIDQADALEYDEKIGKNVQRLIGNVKFTHENTTMTCDSAYFVGDSNIVRAFGLIHINQADSVDLWGEYLNYNGNTKFAELHRKVKLKDKQITLTTEHLNYDMNKRLASYYNGAKIVDKENTLTSHLGYYYSSKKEFFFKDSVLLVNKKYTMNSDTLMYNTSTDVASFFGPTHIRSKDNYIYCENGWYDTKKNISEFNENAYYNKKEHYLRGQKLYYDRNSGIGRAYKDVQMQDTNQKMLITGNISLYNEKKGFAWVTDSALFMQYDLKDTLFLHADTLRAEFVDSTKQGKFLFAYHKAKFFRTDLQGMTDSLVYCFADSTIRLYHDPVIWQEKNQLSAIHIFVQIADSTVKSVHLREASFMIQKDDTLSYNQIKGKTIDALFDKGEIYKVNVSGNGETIYYVRENDRNLIGINKAESANIEILIENREINIIKYLTQPKATLYPETELSPSETYLRGFKWEENKRPKKMKDIFIWN